MSGRAVSPSTPGTAPAVEPTLAGRRILLIVGGGIAAYKALDLIRRLRERGAVVTPVMTRAAEAFVTPLSVGALAGARVHQALLDLTEEAEMGHIQLSRAADLVVVAPATADLLARMAGGRADDLASTLLLATDKAVLAAPAMNVRMWLHPATQRNVARLARGRRALRGTERRRHGLWRIRAGPHGRTDGDRRGGGGDAGGGDAGGGAPLPGGTCS